MSFLPGVSHNHILGVLKMYFIKIDYVMTVTISDIVVRTE